MRAGSHTAPATDEAALATFLDASCDVPDAQKTNSKAVVCRSAEDVPIAAAYLPTDGSARVLAVFTGDETDRKRLPALFALTLLG